MPSEAERRIELARKQLDRCLEAAADGHASISRGTLLDIQDGILAAPSPASHDEAVRLVADWLTSENMTDPEDATASAPELIAALAEKGLLR